VDTEDRLGCQGAACRNQGQQCHGQQLSLRPLRGLWAWATAGPSCQADSGVGRSLEPKEEEEVKEEEGEEEGGGGGGREFGVGMGPAWSEGSPTLGPWAFPEYTEGSID
jgi:hypothetical protein